MYTSKKIKKIYVVPHSFFHENKKNHSYFFQLIEILSETHPKFC